MQSFCFFCLEEVPPEGDQLGGGKLAGCLPYLSRYLKMDLALGLEKDKELKICGECASVSDQFSELYRQLEKIRLEVASKLRQLHGRMVRTKTKVREGKLRKLAEVDGGLRDLKRVRDEAMQKCSEKLAAVQPEVKIVKLSIPKSGRKRSHQESESSNENDSTFPDPDQVSVNTTGDDDPHVAPSDSSESSESDNGSDADYFEESDVKLEVPSPPISSSEEDSASPYAKALEKIRIGTRGNYPCRLCTATSPTLALWQEHCHGVHLQKAFKCNLCDAEFTQSGTFNRHRKSVHLGHRYKCQVCGKLCSQKYGLRQHQRKGCQGPGPATAPTVTEVFVSPDQVKRRSKTLKPPKSRKGQHECTFCGDKFKTLGLWQEHLQNVHEEKPLKCDICGRGFTQSGTLNRHRESVHGEKKFQCDICHKRFGQRGHLTVHRQKGCPGPGAAADLTELLVPPKADERTSTTANKLEVESESDDEDPDQGQVDLESLTDCYTLDSETGRYTCRECGGDYGTLFAWEQHYRSHHLNQKYKCNLCERKFRQQASLYRHRKNFHEGRKFKCNYCGKLCSQRSTLVLHQQTSCPGRDDMTDSS